MLPDGDTLKATPRWQELEAAVARIGPVLLVLDSQVDVFGGNEISRAQARAFIGILRALGVRNKLAVVPLAHPSLSGMASGTGSSGSTHQRNAVRRRLGRGLPPGSEEKEDAEDAGPRRARIRIRPTESLLLTYRLAEYAPPQCESLELHYRGCASRSSLSGEGCGTQYAPQSSISRRRFSSASRRR